MADFSNLKLHSKGTATLRVSGAHTAIALGSGRIEVFATPMMIALMEAAAVDCVESQLLHGTASVGTHIDVTHIAATPVGVEINATAELVDIDARMLTFTVVARDETEVIGRGTHTRAIVDVARFNARLGSKAHLRG